MKLLSSNTIGEAALPQTEIENAQFTYVSRLVKDGPINFASNSHASALALELDNQLIPLIVSDGNPSDTTVSSMPAHYVESPASQLPQLDSFLYATFARLFLFLLRQVLEMGRLGQVAYLNDWLMTTNPEIQLDQKRLKEITRLLIGRFPDRAIIVRSNNHVTRSELHSVLLAQGFEMIRSRRIYLFDPTRDDFKRKENLRKDLRLLRNWPGKIRSGPLDEKEIQRVAELYRGLYLRKYSSGNPSFTNRFFETVLNMGLFESRYLELDGEILAFTAWREDRNSLLGTLVGYDLERPQSMGLLRMAFAVDFATSLESGLPYHVSSGAGRFKRLRGALPATEYDAVFWRHLSRRKRKYWQMFQILMRLAEKFEGERIDLKKAPKVLTTHN
jgi:hypothetical protein